MQRITGKKIDDKNAASANTMGRFETQMLSVKDNLKALWEVNGRWVERALEKTTHRRIILDRDSSASPVHGEQEAATYNGHFGCTCYHPLFFFNQFGDGGGRRKRGDMGRDIVSDSPLEMDDSLAPSVSDRAAGEVSLPIRFRQRCLDNSGLRGRFQRKDDERMVDARVGRG